MQLLRGVLLALLSVLTAYGFYSAKLFQQVIWTGAGRPRALSVLAVYAVFTAIVWIWRRQWFVPALAVAMIVYTIATIGPLAMLAVACFLLSSWRLGKLIGREPALPIGISIWVTLTGLAVHFPVNYPAVYLVALAIPVAWPGPPRLPKLDLGRLKPCAATPLAGLPMVAHWLMSLRPETSADGQAMHLTIPMFIADYHRWTFDAGRFAWAVMPMNGDWAYTIVYLLSGEYAAKLLNFAFLLVIVALLWDILRERLPELPATLALALFLSTPLILLATGSMFIENLLACLILAAMRALDRKDPAAFSILFGAAMATKLGAVAYLLPAACFAIFAMRKARPALWAQAAALFILFAAPPYANAWIRTGNPVFPFQNQVFRSPLFDTNQPLRDQRFLTPLSYRTLYDVTFHSRDYLEGQDGSFGFQHLLLLPVALVLLRRPDPYAIVGLAAAMLVFRQQSYLRYLYPALPMFAIAIGPLFESAGARILALIVISLNCYFLPSSGWYHRDFYFNFPRGRGAENRYMEDAAPVRKLIHYLNTKGGDAPVAILQGNEIAGLRRRAYTNSWHTYDFWKSLERVRSFDDYAALARSLGIEYFIAPTAASGIVASNPHTPLFLEKFTQSETVMGKFYIATWKPNPSDWRLTPVEPGEYDDPDLHVEYNGAWLRDTQFKQAYLGTMTYAFDKGSSFQFSFRGSAITYIFTRAINRGRADIIIDGVSRGILEMEAKDTEWRASATYSGLGPGPHVLLVRVIAGWVDLDGLIVKP